MSMFYAVLASRRIVVGSLIAALLLLSLYWTGCSTPQILQRDGIPSTLHFTQLKKVDNATLEFSFQSFLAVYSAVHFIRPDKVYIHTDFNSSLYEHAKNNGTKWTRKMLTAFPQMEINYVFVPTHNNGMKIDNIEAKSDIIRWEQVNNIGGIYLDWDVLTIRDIRPLRFSGFNNVVGRQHGGKVNSGCFMCKKQSVLTQLMVRNQYKVFDNSWEAHSVQLVTDVSQRLVRSDREVLIMDQAAFGPTNWEAWSADELFQVHNDTAIPMFPQVNDPTEDPRDRWDKKSRYAKWEMDFSTTYFLHAFKSRGHQPPGFHGVSVKYVLARNSNYALAAWPVIQAGIKEGIFSEDDDEP